MPTEYHLLLNGQDAGVFALEELKRRVGAGELSGNEYVRCQGMADWVPLNSILSSARPVAAPPPVPAGAVKPRINPGLLAVIIIAALICTAGAVFLGMGFVKMARGARRVVQAVQARGDGVEAASRPIMVTNNTATQQMVDREKKQFRTRQYLQAYREQGKHTAAWDADAQRMLQAWIAGNYDDPTNTVEARKLADKLAADPSCDDPVVLTAAAACSIELHERIKRLERALPAYEKSSYKAYPRFFATVYRASSLRSGAAKLKPLDEQGLRHFEACLKDGSLKPGEEDELAEALINGYASGFFQRCSWGVCSAAERTKGYEWLAAVLKGEREVKEAWRARGSGTAGTVTAEGWRQFFQHLATARVYYTKAWELRPTSPIAPASMITVAMGEEGAGSEEMRLWFDRATLAQIDYAPAWTKFAWGLRPRWLGSHEAMLALGEQALATKRFDTDVPRKYFGLLSDVESESELQPGEHLFGREDIWPQLQKLYAGYIAESRDRDRSEWRSGYAAVAYLAGKNDVAREQLEALDWKPARRNLSNWGVDLSLMPLKVAALTGKSVDVFKRAESSYERGNLAQALKLFTELEGSTDGLERDFCRARLAAVKQEQQLAKGEWIELMPTDDKDPNWEMFDAKVRCLPEGALEVESGHEGHTLYSRTRVGAEFELTGEFDVVKSSSKDFQAGIIMGMPDAATYSWYAFRLKRNDSDGEIASFSQGWTTRQVSKPISLNRGGNTFQFRIREGKADAWVNGTQVLQRVSPVQNLRLHPGSFLGLGAFNDMNETVVRYKNVKVRRLAPGQT